MQCNQFDHCYWGPAHNCSRTIVYIKMYRTKITSGSKSNRRIHHTAENGIGIATSLASWSLDDGDSVQYLGNDERFSSYLPRFSIDLRCVFIVQLLFLIVRQKPRMLSIYVLRNEYALFASILPKQQVDSQKST